MAYTMERLQKVPDDLRAIGRAAFPGYRGRIFRVTVTDRPRNVKGYWDGGSRSYFAFVRLADKEVLAMPAQSAFDRQIAGADAVPMRPGFVVVEHMIVCGKDRGLVFHVHPSDVRPDMLEKGTPQ